jgi:acyl-CoA thioesterase-1
VQLLAPAAFLAWHGIRIDGCGTLINVTYIVYIQKLLCLTVCLLLWSCQPGGGDFREVQNLASVGEDIISFGDSLTEGVGAGEGKSYPTLLSEGLGRPVINAGRRGDTAAAGLSRLDRDVLGRDPRLVLVLFGGNDFLRRIPLERTTHDLEMMVKRIQDRGAMVVILGLKLGVYRDEYGPMYEDVAEKYGAFLVPDVLAGVLSDPRLKSDAIHPNGAGYELMTERILNKVKPLLLEADQTIRG